MCVNAEAYFPFWALKAMAVKATVYVFVEIMFFILQLYLLWSSVRFHNVIYDKTITYNSWPISSVSSSEYEGEQGEEDSQDEFGTLDSVQNIDDLTSDPEDSQEAAAGTGREGTGCTVPQNFKLCPMR